VTEKVPSMDPQDKDRVFEQHRDLLMAVAYRILGQVADAEDVVQEAWIRWANADTSEVSAPRAFLVRVATRLSIDRLRRVKARRESYVGPWLPEPLLTGGDVAEHAALADSISMAMLVVFETLSPLERAVFVLREAFAMPYAEIAEVLGRSEPAVRQISRRAREHVREGRPRFDTDQEERRRVTERFLEAAAGGDPDALMEVLAPGVTLVADGGGRARAPRRPVRGAEKVARFLAAISAPEKMAQFLSSVSAGPLPGMDVRLAQVNGGPGILATAGETPVATIVLDVADGLVQTIHMVANPEKMSGVREIETP
jgi:RNA polymerase sigma-70 factor (TIGR02957 family)